MSPEPSLTPPEWPHCGHGTTPEDSVGCRGIHVAGHTACLAHLADADCTAYLSGLAPGASVDHRGTPFATPLLDALLDSVRDPATGHPHLGEASFGWATFQGDAKFDDATFTGGARFDEATFIGQASFSRAAFASVWFHEATFRDHAWFNKATFTGHAHFGRATFADCAWFQGANFQKTAMFEKATFNDDAWFGAASFAGDTRFHKAVFTAYAEFGGVSFTDQSWFEEVTFGGRVDFHGATFTRYAWFRWAKFEVAPRLGPLICGETVLLNGAVFEVPVTVMAAARKMSLARTRWASAATLHLRYAELDLSDAVLEYPLTVTARLTPFPGQMLPLRPRRQNLLPETMLSGGDPSVRLASVDGVDASYLVLHDIDLASCLFAGSVHLDQLRVDGWCSFAATPTGTRWHWLLPRWSSKRNTLVEEHHWRFQTSPSNLARGWMQAPEDVRVLRPAALTALYRQLRKSLEDGKNEPDAADFYYGEMEMRRHDDTRSRGERVLLAAYWALSGYGLRATRALTWLGAAMAITIAVMVLWGLPADAPKTTTTGRQAAVGQKVVLTTETPEPVNPTGSLAERVTTERGEKALRVVINSVIFRSSGQDLTTTGTYTEMTSRLAEPVLLGLAILAVRSRVKR